MHTFIRDLLKMLLLLTAARKDSLGIENTLTQTKIKKGIVQINRGYRTIVRGIVCICQRRIPQTIIQCSVYKINSNNMCTCFILNQWIQGFFYLVDLYFHFQLTMLRSRFISNPIYGLFVAIFLLQHTKIKINTFQSNNLILSWACPVWQLCHTFKSFFF